MSDSTKLAKRTAAPDTVAKRRTFTTQIEAWMIPVVKQALESGLPLDLVAGLIQTTRRTMHRWREMGSDPACTDPLLVEFALTVEEARAKAAAVGVQLLQAHAARDYKAALELLRAQDPATWSPKSVSKVEMDVQVESRPTLDLSRLSDAELEVLEQAERLRAKASGK